MLSTLCDFSCLEMTRLVIWSGFFNFKSDKLGDFVEKFFIENPEGKYLVVNKNVYPNSHQVDQNLILLFLILVFPY